MALPLCSASSILNSQCEPHNPSLPSPSLQEGTCMIRCLLNWLLGHFDPKFSHNTEDRIGFWKIWYYHYDFTIMILLLWYYHYDITIMILPLCITFMILLLWYHYDIIIMILPLWYYHYITIMILPFLPSDLFVCFKYDMKLYILFAAIWWTPCGSSTAHIYTQTLHRTTQWNRIHRS